MFEDEEKKAMEEIVKSAVDELMEGMNEAVQTINEEPRMTKEEIMAVKSRRERQKLIAENMDLFKEV